jgi:hypothetical protein
MQNKAKKSRKTHPEFTEIGEIASEDGKKVMGHKKNSKTDRKCGKSVGNNPRKYKLMSLPSGVANFCCRKIPLRTGEYPLGF